MRRLATLGVAVLVVGLATGGLLGNDPANEKEKARIALLTQQLASDKFEIRASASKELEVLGQKAVPALRTAASESPDAEIRQRASRLVQRILEKPRPK